MLVPSMRENLVCDLASEKTEGTPILKCHIMAYLGHMPFSLYLCSPWFLALSTKQSPAQSH